MEKKIRKQSGNTARKKKVQSKYLVLDEAFDAEEQELMDSFERGEWIPVADQKKEREFAKRAAENFFRKDARVTLRLSEGDLHLLQQKAARKGLPYQTFIASILHQYVIGDLQEKAA